MNGGTGDCFVDPRTSIESKFKKGKDLSLLVSDYCRLFVVVLKIFKEAIKG